MNSPPRISIIIPLLNEENYIGATLDHLYQCKSVSTLLEIIAIDAGSSDGTVEILNQYEDLSIEVKPSFLAKKYLSLNYGATKATSDILLFLDADTYLPHHFDRHILNALKNGAVGGAFMLRHNNRNWLLWCIEQINTIRYAISKWFFGDQAVFCLKSAFEQVNGFPEKDIMESAFFCKKLKKVGTLKLIRQYVTASSRRFEKRGVLMTFLIAFKIWGMSILGISTAAEAKKYWSE